MAHYGSRSAKRHQGFSNSKWVELYNLGKLRKAQRTPDPTFKPTRSYLDRNGKKRWAGTRQLKQTQPGSLLLEIS